MTGLGEVVVEVHPAAAVLVEAVAAGVVVDAVVEINLKQKIMKKIFIHTTPVLLSFIWLIFINHTLSPVTLKGPDFLNFYLILIVGFYMSIYTLKFFKASISKITFYFMISIFLLGIVKLIRGISLGKPVGFLIMILIFEIIVFMFLNLNHKMK
ncbi:hypothetical protein [Flavobacterium sp. B17]|uniref:hypothetical protein n=1 Tax=Flavobacterium sp. B17 TaxID=95618 RepID=UPI001FCBC2FC|nr:hypothetical protein [Flavobacterium sp. B17]